MKKTGFEGWSVIVTGGASGIGRATAWLLARSGCKITIADMNRDAGAETVAQIRSEHGEAQYVHTDITDDPAVEAMVAASTRAFGQLRGAANQSFNVCRNSTKVS